jgi:signal transduction histidine kinase/DNA-binding response OmpR family regulator/CHASE3 domain sensor protein
MSMQRNLNRGLSTGFTISLVLLLASAVASYYTINRLIESTRLVDHSHRVLQAAENIISNIKDGEAGQRGYLLTRQLDFLEPYNGAKDRTIAALNQVRELTIGNPQQQINCDSLEIAINNRFSILAQSIADAQDSVAINIFRLRDGHVYMRQALLLVQRIQHIEEDLLLSHTSQLNQFVRFAPIAIILATLLALLITIFFFKRVLEDSKAKSIMADELRHKDIETRNRIDIIEKLAARFAAGDYSTRLNMEEKDELGNLSASLNKMAAALDLNFRQLSANQWQQEGTARLSERIAGEKDLNELSAEALSFLAEYTNSQVGAVYLVDTDMSLYVAGGFALPVALQQMRIKTGEGLPGQCFDRKKEIWLKSISDNLYTTFSSGVIKPKELLLIPVLFEGHAVGVIELGTINSYEQYHVDYLKRISEMMGIAINTARNRTRLKELLEETQAQSEELQAQHRELENINAELEVQAEKLQTSEEELKVQQEELMETNQELQERSRQLEEKNHMIVLRNLEIQKKAEELTLSTRYKSEFLANMSHELRTPLNSVLLLSRLLSENNQGNLNKEQIEYAQVIQSSGQGLLQLIDEILDLSKIESGKLELEYERIPVNDIVQNMRTLFLPMANEKNVNFTVQVDGAVPGIIETDKLRLEQILKNLISNALKFTHSGSIDLLVSLANDKENFIDFTVVDSGIGIPEDKQQLIFEAFQQADGSTKRKYGGTGLGLSISRQLARLLHGDISLESTPGKGSRFTLTIPLFKATPEKQTAKKEIVAAEAPTPAKTAPSPFIATDIPNTLADDSHNIKTDDKVLLVVEDDVHFAKALLDFARQKNYKVIHIVRGDMVLETAARYKPLGILLDIQLPMKDGLTVMDELKKDSRTRHIPVHIMSSFEVKKESLHRGAIDFINKPVLYEQMNMILEKIEQVVNTDLKKVLIVEDNTHHAKALAYYLSTNKIEATISSDIQEGMQALQKKEVTCVILDMGLPGTKAYEALDIVRQNTELENVPIIIFTGQSLSRQDETKIRQYADTIVVKTAHSYQRILNEVSLFLHLVDQQDDKKPPSVRSLGKMDEVLKNKTVLIADDDVRNIFALTKALEKHKMSVITAVDGKEALQLLEKNDNVDIVLMDMMMPEMDGYEAILRIRKNPKWKRLPVIAVTAKAMMGDREKCIQAGASDYISKPVDSDQLLSLMRVWLYETV